MLRVPFRNGAAALLLCDRAAARGANAEPVAAPIAAAHLEAALADGLLRVRIARAVHASATPRRAGLPTAWLRGALERGDLLVLQQPRRRVVVPLDDAVDSAALGPEPERQDVEFVVEYFDGTPARGLRYVLRDPAGRPEKGALPADGAITKRDAVGAYALSLVEIDLLEWARSRVRAKQDVGIVASVSGIDDGAQGKITIFRLYDEDPKRAVATLAAPVKNGRVEASWKYEPASPAEAGLASFVAELAFEDGKVWRKTAPLVVELADVASVRWSEREASAGDDVALEVKAPGFEDGAEVKVTLVRQKNGADETIGDLPAMTLAKRVARAELRCGDAALPARTGDVYAKVTVKKDGVERTGCSPLLWVSAVE